MVVLYLKKTSMGKKIGVGATLTFDLNVISRVTKITYFFHVN